MLGFNHVAALAVVLFTTVVGAEGAPKPLTLEAGKSQLVSGGKIDRIALGDPEVADIAPEGDHAVRVKGLKAGKTELHIWSGKQRRDYLVTVTGSEAAAKSETLTVKVGETLKKELKGLKRVAVSDPKVATVRGSATGLDITGLAEGTTDVVLFTGDGHQTLELHVTP